MGGITPESGPLVELYDPATGVWSSGGKQPTLAAITTATPTALPTPTPTAARALGDVSKHHVWRVLRRHGIHLRRVARRTLRTQVRVSRVRSSACSDLAVGSFSDTVVLPRMDSTSGSSHRLGLSLGSGPICVLQSLTAYSPRQYVQPDDSGAGNQPLCEMRTFPRLPQPGRWIVGRT